MKEAEKVRTREAGRGSETQPREEESVDRVVCGAWWEPEPMPAWGFEFLCNREVTWLAHDSGGAWGWGQMCAGRGWDYEETILNPLIIILTNP